MYERQLLETVNILSLPEKVKYYNLVFTLKTIVFDLSGAYVKHFFTLKAAGRTRSSSKNLLVDSFKNISVTYDKSFRSRAIKDWNSLPTELSVIINTSLQKFKTNVCKWLVSNRQQTPQSLYYPP